MFTGIIQAVGSITALEKRGGDMRIGINSGNLPMDDVCIGDSIAVSGVCLTVVELGGNGFSADVSGETLGLTMLSAPGRQPLDSLQYQGPFWPGALYCHQGICLCRRGQSDGECR